MRYLVDNPALLLRLTAQHLALTVVSLVLALCLAVPLGILAARRRTIRGPLLGILGIIYTIPSLAFFVILIPLMGLGVGPALTALVAYAQIILVRNITVALLRVDPAVVEAARGMGMSARQCLWQVEMPLALPVVLAGVRVATLAIIGIGTVAAFINAGGLGTLLFMGVGQNYPDKIVAGAVALGILALSINTVTRALENRAFRAVLGEGSTTG
jgi:osmoprotectant transport system permease protein